MDKHYNPAISRCLQNFAEQRDWQGLLLYLDGLSNAQFRTAGYMLGERTIPELDESDMWTLISSLVAHNAKAFLVTMMKAVACYKRRSALRTWQYTASCHSAAGRLNHCN